jgi:hypothetical protein
MVEGSQADIALVKSVFSNRSIHDWYVYDLPGGSVRAETAISNHHPQI